MPDQTLTPFGQLMKVAMRRKAITQRRLGRMLSVDPEGPIFDATTIRMIQQGERRLSHDLVAQIVDILADDDEETDAFWHAARLVPQDWSLEAFRRAAQAHRRRRGDRQLDSLAATGAVSDQQRGATSGYWLIPAQASGTAESVQPAQLAQVAA
jgi:hypothetical protein